MGSPSLPASGASPEEVGQPDHKSKTVAPSGTTSGPTESGDPQPGETNKNNGDSMQVEPSQASSSVRGPLTPKSTVAPASSVAVTTIKSGRAQSAGSRSVLGPSSTSSPLQSSSGHIRFRESKDSPFSKLTVSLIHTYMYINEVYYKRKEDRQRKRARESLSSRSNFYNNGYDDSDYNYIVKAGEVLAGRYRLENVIGKGSFGQVIAAYDIQEHKDVAVKIIKSKTAFYEQARTEISLLLNLNEGEDSSNQHNIVQLLDHFEIENHKCLVFEMLSLTLYDLLRNTSFKGVSLNLVRKFAASILRTLRYLRKKKVIHCDLKPENILLRDRRHSAIKVIDFGSSCYCNQTVYTYIQSRFYRSPEVLLSAGQYGLPIDMWSLGCILVEMHTGEPLFSGHNEQEQIVKMWELLGLPPKEMIAISTKADNFFDFANGKYQLKNHASATKRTLDSVLNVKPPEPHDPTHTRFKDLVLRMLDYNPATRITPEKALLHPFFTQSFHQTTNTEAAADEGESSSATAASPPPLVADVTEGATNEDKKTREMGVQVT